MRSLSKYRISISNIRRNKLRNSMVILSFILAVLLGSIILGPVYGIQNYYVKTVNEAGFNVIAIFSGNFASSSGSFVPPTKYLNISTVSYIEKLENVYAVAPVFLAGYFVFGNKSAYLVGTNSQMKQIATLDIFKGNFVGDSPSNSQFIKVDLGYNVWNYLLKGIDVNQTVSLSLIIPYGYSYKTVDISLKVIGLLKERPKIPSINVDPNNIIIANIYDVFNFLNFTNYNLVPLDAIFVSAKDFNSIDNLESNIIATLKNLGFTKDKDYSIISQKDALYYINNVFSQFYRFLNIIWAAILSISSLSILIVMFITVRERYKEIGTLRAIGARKIDVLTMILVEAFVLSLIGVVIGMVLGYIILNMLKFYYAFMQTVTDSIIILTYSVIVPEILVSSIVFSLYPAYIASKVAPSVALRYE